MFPLKLIVFLIPEHLNLIMNIACFAEPKCLMEDHHFPRKLIEIACQHHGQNIVKYFFTKSKSEVEDQYRYKGKKPTCIEAMVLLVCDGIEARSRAEVKRDNFDPKEIIESTINELLADGQLEDVVMRLGDLQKLKEALAKELQGTYQKRVDYADAEKEADNAKKSDKDN